METLLTVIVVMAVAITGSIVAAVIFAPRKIGDGVMQQVIGDAPQIEHRGGGRLPASTSRPDLDQPSSFGRRTASWPVQIGLACAVAIILYLMVRP